MEQLIWETAEELDQKLAQRIKNIKKTTFHFSGEIVFYERRKLWLHQKI